MYLCFNELSFHPKTDNSAILAEHLKALLKVFATAKSTHGIKHLLFEDRYFTYEPIPDTLFLDWVKTLQPTLKNQLLSIIKKPFTLEVIEPTNALDGYYFSEAQLGLSEVDCIGIAAAHRLDSACLSLLTHDFWENASLDAYRMYEQSEMPDERISVLNVAVLDQLNSAEFRTYAESFQSVVLVESNTNPDDKPIKLRDDHGKDVLDAFAKRILRSPHLLGVVNSLPFNSNSVRFIRAVKPDGLIELVLFWEDKGYGMVVQSTGRNLRETEKIAKLIEEKYAK